VLHQVHIELPGAAHPCSMGYLRTQCKDPARKRADY
jgi:hypothetical protein